MRLLIVCGNFQVGGAETVAAELTAGLVAHGHDVVVASIARGGPMAEAFIQRGGRVYQGLARGSVDLLAPWRFAQLIRRERIDGLVVLDPLRNGLLYALVGSLLSGRSVGRLCWCHSWPGGQAGRFGGRLAVYYHLGLLAGIVCVSRAQRKALEGKLVPRRALPVIRNGRDMPSPPGGAIDRAALGLGSGEKCIVQVANVMPDKDFQTLLRATKLLAARREDFRVFLVGRGTDGPELASAIRQAGLGRRVAALGPRQDVAEILAAADVFVLSSKRETFGLAPLEAMAAGVAVVASDLPALDDLFTDGREGLKVPPGDAQALARALDRLLADDALARRLGQAGRQRAEQFGTGPMVRRFERLLRLVCGGRPRGG